MKTPSAAPAPSTSERVVFGVRPVEELCRARPREVAVIYVADGHRPGEMDRVIAMARDRAIAVEIRPRALIADLARGAPGHQGIVAIAGPYAYADVDETLDAIAARGEAPLVVVLDGVTDPHNLGAVARSAEVLGGQLVILPEKGSAPVNAGAVKASAGATERLPIARVGNVLRTIDRLRERGQHVWGAAAGQGEPLAKLDLRGPTAFVLGSEGRGTREAVARRCSGLVQIPQRGLVDSLNVSVAGAILLYEAMRQRQG